MTYLVGARRAQHLKLFKIQSPVEITDLERKVEDIAGQSRNHTSHFEWNSGIRSSNRIKRTMKTLLFNLLASLLMIMPILADQPGPSLGVSVEVEGKAAYRDVKGSSTRTKTQTRKLQIEVSTLAKEDIPGTKVKWTIFGHTLKNHHLVKLKNGENTVTVPGFKKVNISSAELKVTGTREHTVTVRKRSRGKTITTLKRVAALGEEYYGYAVEVYLGGKLVTAKYSHPGLEKELHPERK